MITCGLRRYGYHEIARDIAIRHLQAMCQVWENPAYGSIWECYAPDVMAPAINDEGETVRSDFVGWSGLGPVSMLIESILVFHMDAATNTIHWRIAHHAAHGIRRLAFNGRIVDLIASEPDGAGKRKITINLSDSLNLMISLAGRSADTGRQLTLPAGCSDPLMEGYHIMDRQSQRV